MLRSFHINFTTDIHGFFSPVNYADGSTISGGAACCFRAFQQDGNSLTIDGGDTLQGSPFTYFLHKTENRDCIPARVMNLGGYDFFTLGNHDFNYGPETLQEYINGFRAKCLCANVAGLKGVEKTAVVTLENGLKIGLTGVVTHFVNVWEKPENLKGITITHPVPAAAEALAALKAAGADVTVCIYHGGFENDLVTGEGLSETDENQGWRICHELDFDILLSGHQHLNIENAEIFGTHACQTADKARGFISLDCTVSGNGEKTITSRLVSPAEKPATEAEALLAPYDAECAKWLDVPVGHLSCELSPRDHLDMALHGCSIANFFNQVQLAASGADISCTSLANEVKGFSRNISVRDVTATYIYPNTLVTLEVTGAVLRRALERCAEYFELDEDGNPRVSDKFLKPKVEHYNFDYFSGIDVTIDIRKPAGSRVISICKAGTEIDPKKTYTLCMNNYRASGTGGFEFFRDCKRAGELPTEISELITEYLLTHDKIEVDLTPHLKVLW